MKTCKICNVQKEITDFYQRTEDPNKRMVVCKPCANARSRKNYRIKKATKRGHALQIFNKRKNTAKQNGIKFDIDFEYMSSLPMENCAMFNTPLTWCELSDRPRDNTPSIDKIIPEKGYIKGNVAWVSHRANTLKNNGTTDEHLKIAQYIYHHTKTRTDKKVLKFV
jgi:hypothetical protein